MNFIMAVPTLAWLTCSALVFAVGEFLSKKFALSPSLTLGLIIPLVYGLGALPWLPAIVQKNQLSTTGVIWAVLSLLCTVAIGVLFFGERPGMTAIAGIILAFASIVLLSL